MWNCIKPSCLYFVINALVLGACKNEEPPTPAPIVLKGSQIIADHTVVDKFDNIPQYYIDEVKKMLVWFPGEFAFCCLQDWDGVIGSFIPFICL